MKCSKCNCENSSTARFCRHCGALLPSPDKKQNGQPSAKKVPKDSGGINNLSKIAKRKERLFMILQLLIYLLIAAVTVLFVFFEKGVRVRASFGEDAFKDFSFFSVITDLITGGERCNPTAISIIIGVSTVILVFCSAFFWIVNFVSKIIRKFHKESHIMTLIMTGLNLAMLCSTIPLASRFAGIFTQICARKANFLPAEITSIGSVWIFIFTGVIIFLVALELVFASKENKIRKQYKEGMLKGVQI